MLNLGQQVQHAHAHRAVAYAITAAGAEDLAELFRIDRKLVQNALPLTRRLKRSRIVSGGVQREDRELARVQVRTRALPAAGPASTMSKQWQVGQENAQTPHAMQVRPCSAQSGPRSGRRQKPESCRNQTWVQEAARPYPIPLTFLSSPRTGPAFLGDAAHLETAAAEREQNRIATASGVRSKADGGAEARIVRRATGNGDDRGCGPPAVVEIVREIPIENMVQDGQRRRVAGTRARINCSENSGRARSIECSGPGCGIGKASPAWERRTP